MILATLLLLSQGAFPSEARTTWMSPSAFHLELGMRRADVIEKLERSRWRLEPARNDELVLEYDSGRTLTLAFRKNRLESIRFELVDFIPRIESAFEELKARMNQEMGPPSRVYDSALLYDDRSPKIYVVASTRRDTSFGRQGLGFVAVRYFVPAG